MTTCGYHEGISSNQWNQKWEACAKKRSVRLSKPKAAPQIHSGPICHAPRVNEVLQQQVALGQLESDFWVTLVDSLQGTNKQRAGRHEQ